MSLSAKILFPFLGLLILFALNTVYSMQLVSDLLSHLSQSNQSFSSLGTSFHKVDQEATLIQQDLNRWSMKIVPSSTLTLPQRLASIHTRISEGLIHLKALTYPPSMYRLRKKARILHIKLSRIQHSLLYLYKQDQMISSQLLDEWSWWRRSLQHFKTQLTQSINSENQRLTRLEDHALKSGIGVTLFYTCLTLLLMVYLYRLLTPLKLLKQGVQAVEKGQYDYRIHLKGKDALAQLAQALDQMAATIESRDQQLETQQRERVHQARLITVGRLSAQITHELRNPLSSIGLNSELLMDELEGQEEAQVLLKEIAREVERLKEITEEYLRFARLPRPEPMSLDLNAFCAEVIEFYKVEYQAVGVRLLLDHDPQPWEALADPNQLRSALLNLLRNAREALESQGGRVVIKVRSWGKEGCIEVSDDGPGLSKEALLHLFEPFFSTKLQGTGLGLSMVKQIIEAQGGRIEVDPLSNQFHSEKKEGTSMGGSDSSIFSIDETMDSRWKLKGATFRLFVPLV